MMIEQHNDKLKEILDLLVKKDVCQTDSGFSADKDAIQKIFEVTVGDGAQIKKSDILIRLTLIDSMYSTQMGRRYYALEELADVLDIVSVNNGGLKQLFMDFAKDPEKNISKFDYQLGKKTSNLWAECYGIGKDGSEKGIAISLISKYAYFETGCKFPIYDSIACEMYPMVWKKSGFEGKSPKILEYINYGKIDGKQTIVNFIKAINLLIEKINHPELNYDLLDRYLWYVGKIRRGNLSLILTRDQYEDTIKVFTLETITKKDGKTYKNSYFNIDNVNLGNISYLNDNDLLRMFFEMAKYYGYKK